jgi:Ser/Thr protein kinase RdoA (MazF antagonist)
LKNLRMICHNLMMILFGMYGASMFGVSMEALTKVGGSMNFVFEYIKNDKPYILRFTPSRHRNLNLVKGELDWLLFLDRNGLSVSTPVESLSGKLVEEINSNNSLFMITSFIKAMLILNVDI